MPHGFELAAGSTVGRDHRRAYRNNQDSYAIEDDGEVAVAIVADGCGSGRHSEAGALIGARLAARSIQAAYDPDVGSVDWDMAESHILSELDRTARAIGDHTATILDTFLFTLVGVVADSATTTFFATGDGTIIVNGEPTKFEYPNNQPPYLTYALLAPGSIAVDPDLLRLRPVRTEPTVVVHSFLLGTDGVDDLVRHTGTNLPGSDMPVGPIDQFWTDDRYFGANPELLNRRLRLIGRDWPLHDPDPGLLHDDTTLIVGRRTTTTESEEQCPPSVSTIGRSA